MKALRTVIVWVLVLYALQQVAIALDAARKITQYAHTAWRLQDGYFDGEPTVLAQTKDGYIWVGTESGLLRFNGVRFVPWTPLAGNHLPVVGIYALRGTSDGSLWIGVKNGLLRWKNGLLTDYETPPSGSRISSIVEDRQGNVWATRIRVTDGFGPLCEVLNRSLHCYGKSNGIEANNATSLVRDSSGSLWMGGGDTLTLWRRNSVETYSDGKVNAHADLYGIADMAAAPDGSIWVGFDHAGPGFGLEKFHNGKWNSFRMMGFDSSMLEVTALLLDREGSLWVGTASQGVYRIHGGQVDSYRSADGLSSDTIQSFLEDAEGNIWIATSRGIDNLRDIPIASYSKAEGLSGDDVGSVAASSHGALWIGNEGALDILRDGVVSSIRHNYGLPGMDVTSILFDHEGTAWVGVDEKLFTYKAGKFTEVLRPGGRSMGIVTCLYEDPDANIWAVTSGVSPHLVKISRDRTITEFGDLDFSDVLVVSSDPDGGMWVSFNTGALAILKNGRLKYLKHGDTDNAGTIVQFQLGSDDTTWAASTKGVVELRNERWHVLDSRNGLPCSTVYSIIFDSDHDLWIGGNCGIVRVDERELERWVRNPSSQVKFQLFDGMDGAHLARTRFSPPVTITPDGVLWFASHSLLERLDPHNLHLNWRPPPVHIEGLIADRTGMALENPGTLPPLTHEVEIDYTALSFVAPFKVRFRYILWGFDKVWHDANSRRAAFYTDLPPGKYTFQVVACNNNNIWNKTGARITFGIAAAWYQTYWFKGLCILAALMVLFLLYHLRMKRYNQMTRIRFDERLEERTRVAREFHDTFLQTIQVSKMVADQALDDRDDPVQANNTLEHLSRWLGRAAVEGRASLQALRGSAAPDGDLAGALKMVAEEYCGNSSLVPTVRVVGDSVEMHPVVRDEVYQIGHEAIYNACSHSNGHHLFVELEYGTNFALRVRDDGTLGDPSVLETGRPRHFGLMGMRERAVTIGAKIAIKHSAERGTEIVVSVPGKAIFLDSSNGRLAQLRRLLRRRPRSISK